MTEETEGKVKDCCKQPANLILHQERPDVLIRVCKVCNCRHFEFQIDPGRMGVVGASM
jgi:hypothetical protein